ncbi:tripartite tricarboxylate transporter permease [Spiribacter halobius]|uniref:DUF112 domain-containing protein n=1 Tax=Sediminicurvatus halobius TaxID=2182432 RepID=A0A2U2N184_9GAMM|nr:tripartite tricarboxylate transporter permease [Spiribacter halobius]PWG62734.1 hypothetical protein DEM34_11345 [Spiribacter halobius]UEX77403.1 tripartite tricarboxylate transporter permease [Spiribacter halobius]
MSDLITGLSGVLLDPATLGLFVFALIGGIVFGSIPGISGVTLAAILLPFTAGMSTTQAVMTFAVLYVSSVYGGAITAILFNIPGSPNNAPACFDGYPMTLNGQSGKAIGAAVTASALGGTVSALVMMLATESIAGWAVRAFGPPEIFALVVFGLTVAGAVGAQTLSHGWLSVCLGLLLATIGTSPAGNVPRFNMGSTYLMGGIEFVAIILGVFAVSEVLKQGQHIAEGIRVPPKIGIDFPSFAEFWALKLAVFRSIIIGFFSGILPGIGATLAAFLGYNEAVRWSRNPKKFGTGTLEGVVAPEVANNAATGAAMVPLLALGIPGGALTAMMLAAFQMHGLDPGPALFMTSRELVWTVFVAMLLANMSIMLLGYLETKTIVHLLRIPFPLLAPIILMLGIIGAYAVRNLMLDVWVMLIAGIAAFVLRGRGYSMAGVVLGVILGQIGEGAFVKAMPIMNYELTGFLYRPVALVLLLGAVLSVAISAFQRVRRARKEAGRDGLPADASA